MTSARTTRPETFGELLLRLELHAQRMAHALPEADLLVAGERYQQLRRRAEAPIASVEPAHHVRRAPERCFTPCASTRSADVARVERTDEPPVRAGESVEVAGANVQRKSCVGPRGFAAVWAMPDGRRTPSEQEQGEETHSASVADLASWLPGGAS